MGEHRKTIYIGENNPSHGKPSKQKGIPRPQEVRDKISKSHVGMCFSPIWRKRISETNKGNPGLKGKKNPMYGRSDLARKAALVAMKNYRGNYLNGKYAYKMINMRSSWEVSFAEWLDSQGLHWDYEIHKFDCGELGMYIPDFYVVEWNLFVEIKGWQSDVGMKKFEYFKQNHESTALLFDENIMKHLSLI